MDCFSDWIREHASVNLDSMVDDGAWLPPSVDLYHSVIITHTVIYITHTGMCMCDLWGLP